MATLESLFALGCVAKESEEMVLALFYYTLVVLLASALTAAGCLSAYLVSRNKMMLFACAAFLFYFFDVAWAFQADFFTDIELGSSSAYGLAMSMAYLVTGCGFLTSFWLLLCEYFDVQSRAAMVVPAVVFVVASLVAFVVLPEGNIHDFLFFLPRELYMAWLLVFAAHRYLATKNDAEWKRLARHRPLFAVLCVLVVAVVVEDVLAFLPDEPIAIWFRAHTLERNISENILLLVCMVVACKNVVQLLSLRFEKPPTGGGSHREATIDNALPLYAKRYGLSDRECEVLRYVLLGFDNQNIASVMNLALSTVKVHVHNILQKTGQSNRQALMQDFWKRS